MAFPEKGFPVTTAKIERKENCTWHVNVMPPYDVL